MTETRQFFNWTFELIGNIEPERRADGAILSLLPQARLEKAAVSKLHIYGGGPFCRFKIGRKRSEPGLYVLTRDGDPVYAGECVNLGKRWGANGYGGISPRNCYDGGQPTNCRINNAILLEAMQGATLALWFVALDGPTDARRSAETELIQALRPPWNRAKMK